MDRQVSQRFDRLAGKFLFDRLRRVIDQLQHGAHLGIFLLGQLLALRALAVGPIIVDRHGEHRGLRLGPHRLKQLFRADADYVAIRATKLWHLSLSPALHQREVLGVFVKVLRRRHEPIAERMAKEAVAPFDFAAVLFFEPSARTRVHAVSGAPIAVKTVVDAGLAVFERGDLAVVD